jgi:hypothetical protein
MGILNGEQRNVVVAVIKPVLPRNVLEILVDEVAQLLTLLSLNTKFALTVTALGILEALASVTTGFTPLVTGLRNVFGKTHDQKKVRKRTDYYCSTSLGGIWVIIFIFFQGRHCSKDDRINGGEETRHGKEL